jgi:hypothetical protein
MLSLRKYINNYMLIIVTTLLCTPMIAAAQIKYELENFIKIDKVEDLLTAILQIFIIVATPIIVIAIIYAGFLYVTARGNAEQVQRSTRALTYAIIGGLLVLGAVAVSQILADTIGALTK